MNKRSNKGGFCAKVGVENKNKSHSRGFLSAVSTTFKGKRGGDPRLRPSGMTPYEWPSGMTFNLMGFTLIELLVVVLIIGILAAVALPQYNKAVKKSQGAEALVAMDALDKALTNYYLEYGTYEGIGVDKLNMDLPELQHFKYAVGSDTGSSKLRDTNFSVGPTVANVLILLVNNDIRIEFRHFRGEGNSRRCYSRNSSPTSCASYFNCKETPRTQLGVGCWTGGDCLL